MEYGGGIEYEAKFLDIDIHKFKKLLHELDAKLVHKRTKLQRAVFFRADNNTKGFARVRSEPGKITLTCKIYKNDNFPEEYEISINETFDDGVKFMESLGLKQKAYQESYREKYGLPIEGLHEITIDEMPGLPPYVEVECESEDALNNAISKLKLSKEKMRKGGFDKTYEEYYGIPREVLNDKTESLTFKNISNELKPTKNTELFKLVSEHQMKYE